MVIKMMIMTVFHCGKPGCHHVDDHQDDDGDVVLCFILEVMKTMFIV